MNDTKPREAEPLVPADAPVPVVTGFYMDPQGGRWEVLFIATNDPNDRDGEDLPQPATYEGPSLSGVPATLTFRKGQYGYYYFLSEWRGPFVVYAREQSASDIAAGIERELLFTSEEHFAGKENGMRRFQPFERVEPAPETATA